MKFQHVAQMPLEALAQNNFGDVSLLNATVWPTFPPQALPFTSKFLALVQMPIRGLTDRKIEMASQARIAPYHYTAEFESVNSININIRSL